MARRAPPHTRTDLLRAAEACFAEHGLEATKVEDITSRAGIAKGAFYSYFERKEDCWKEIVDAFLVRLADACGVSPVMRCIESGGSLKEQFENLVAHDVEILDFCWENRVLLQMLLGGAGGASYAYLLDEFATRAAKNVEAVLRALMDAGVYRSDVDTSVVAVLLGGAYDGLVREMIRCAERPDIEAMCRQAHRLFVHGLLADGARAALARAGRRDAVKESTRPPPLRAAPLRHAGTGGRRRA